MMLTKAQERDLRSIFRRQSEADALRMQIDTVASRSPVVKRLIAAGLVDGSGLALRLTDAGREALNGPAIRRPHP